jgi:hypothetical protein
MLLALFAAFFMQVCCFAYSLTLKIEMVWFSEISVDIHWTMYDFTYQETDILLATTMRTPNPTVKRLISTGRDKGMNWKEQRKKFNHGEWIMCYRIQLILFQYKVFNMFHNYVRSEVIAAVTLKITDFWNVTPCT